MNDHPELNFDQCYGIMAYWGARRETPMALADRFLSTIDALSAIDPAFGDWYVGRTVGMKLASLSGDAIIDYIAEGVATHDDGTADPDSGYYFSATTGLMRRPRNFIVRVHGGKSYDWNYFSNTASINADPLSSGYEDFICYRVFRSALLALVSSWDPTWCGASPDKMRELSPRGTRDRAQFGLEWMTYLSPLLAPLVTPPPTSINERTPEGGLLMAATEERFDIANPMHMVVAADIEAALAPVNALPWPPEKALR